MGAQVEEETGKPPPRVADKQGNDMTTNFRRIALLTGVSAAALGISNLTATSALASPQGLADGTYAGSFTNATLIEICDLANNVTGPNPPCFFGVIDTTGPSSTATINLFANGQAVQSATGTATAYLTGLAEWGAYASANNFASAGADANANANMFFGFAQLPLNTFASLPGSADLFLDNGGTMAFGAVANAFASDDANATASMFNAQVLQYANKSGAASLSIENTGEISIAALAYASGGGTAYAEANIGQGTFAGGAIAQIAYGSTVDIDFNNSGAVDIVALAVANGGDAGAFNEAYASVDDGLIQFASGYFTGTVDLNNAAGGSITIAAIADAGGGNANAYATVDGGIIQDASAKSGLASVGIDNDGSILIEAIALAEGTTSVDAVAHVSDAIDQAAYATFGTAGAIIDNDGSIVINGLAYASGTGGATANANAEGDDLIEQDVAVAFGSAYASIANGAGDVIDANFTAVADGRGGASLAFATAHVDDFIEQNVAAVFSGYASAVIANAGAISLDVNAIAHGYLSASAFASIDGGIEQTVTGKSGATALIDNDLGGVISINAAAIATGGDVYAEAIVNSALEQNVQSKSGDAFASILNDGAIEIGAFASAVGDAQAVAIINGAMVQNALASEYETIGYGSPVLAAVTSIGADANVTLINNGTIDIHATAFAHDTVLGPATATAIVNDAIVQNATATDGFAGVVIDGTGSIDILAYASAIADSGPAFAYASVNDAIDQNAISNGGPNAGLATAYLSQGGGIDIVAVANASGKSAAYATALIGDGGIDQFASATAYATALANNTAVAIAQINNSATINIIADAQATATGFLIPFPSATPVIGSAIAFASVEAGIHQTANAFAKSAVATVGGLEYDGVAYATADLDNSGTLNVGALAEANGGVAYATALVGVGIDQNVFASAGSTAVAGAFISNDGGDINVFAAAEANGTFAANAYASVGTGISQNVDAFAKEGAAVAVASIQNSGDIVISADAVAAAGGVDVFGDPIPGGASAIAVVGQGIRQDAYASGLEYNTGFVFDGASLAFASANIDNDGLIAVLADASAAGSGAFALAAVGTGIAQDVTAKSGVTATAIADIDNALYATIAVGADADAIGGGFASAIAAVGTGIDQFANAEAKSGPAFASVNLSNDGLIAVTADAFASASGFANAVAVVSQGIDQAAVASGSSGTASAILANSGTILVSADAYATGNTAIATAVVGTGIQQGAFGVDLGYASISNALGGDILIVAEADADGNEPSFARAVAVVGVGISQQATATATSGVAIANINNSGTILVLADAEGANASEGSASAIAVIGSGINQFATASFVADADLDNSGSIDVIALASATADDDAFALASIGTVLFQGAFATGTLGYASADIVNSGSIVGLADANALGGDTVSALAFVSNGIVQVAVAGTIGSATATANASFLNATGAYITMLADADALGGGDGLALASASGGFQGAFAGGGANVAMTNNGSLIVSADADVLVGNAAQKGASAVAFATASGWSQVATANTATADTLVVFTTAFPGTAIASDYLTGVGFTFKSGVSQTPTGPATASFVNNGVMSVTAGASAVGDDFALAVASVDGIDQFVHGDPAYATVQNYGTMVFAADAFASGDNGAVAIASANGIDQYASAGAFDFLQVVTGTATLHYTTGGTVIVDLNNNASDYATAFLSFTPTGHASVLFENNGTLVVAASAEAVVNLGAGDGVTSPAFAGAFATGVEQFARGATATAEVVNDGYITVLANAVADGATAAAASAFAIGISQGANAVATDVTVFAHYETVTSTTPLGHTNTYLTFVTTAVDIDQTNVGLANALVDNSGSIVVRADAEAVAASSATAFATAVGIGQAVAGTEANAAVINSGDITVVADAYASGSSAFASAFALGIGQFLAATSMNASLYNTGELAVVALAGATGTTGAAFAHAIGYSAAGSGGGTLNVDVFNAGSSIFVGAEAIAPGTAVATAQGIVLSNAPTFTATGTQGNPITGYLTNAGLIDVIAYASGGVTSSAYATGISVASGINTMVITNTGDINVDAVTVNGGNAQARGIYVTANGDTTPLATDLLTINNDGDIIVREFDRWRRNLPARNGDRCSLGAEQHGHQPVERQHLRQHRCPDGRRDQRAARRDRVRRDHQPRVHAARWPDGASARQPGAEPLRRGRHVHRRRWQLPHGHQPTGGSVLRVRQYADGRSGRHARARPAAGGRNRSDRHLSADLRGCGDAQRRDPDRQHPDSG